MLVLLEKEQSLVTDDWPWPIQYRSATGYGCPDTAPCDSEYYGLFNQVYNAAKQFVRYKTESQYFNFRANRTSNIQYHPDTSCGTKSVSIQGHATAGLYNYTPYTPNQAALNNLYGSGNSCSSYGNRNFWRLYNEWFGSSQKVTCSSTDRPSKYIFRSYSAKNHRHYFSRYECERDTLAYYGGYSYEGVAFTDADRSQPNVIPVYRVHDFRSGYRFWTINKNEKDNLIKNHGWGDDGIGFYEYNRKYCIQKTCLPTIQPRLKSTSIHSS